MRDPIARALVWVLSVLPWTRRPRPGRHSAEYLAARTSEPAPARPWTCPWAGPSAREVRAVFHDARARGLPTEQRERHYAAALATLGIDYDFPTTDLGSVVTVERAAA
ncbi:hypothetical protein ACFXAZ_09220 [Streptomyces sp. NPDC059477]|uniref:hypothetical protein n=1 Tax=Streptomyces sp. NPDC059477 TaxID=3346847 RepID=UPI0036A1A157